MRVDDEVLHEHAVDLRLLPRRLESRRRVVAFERGLDRLRAASGSAFGLSSAAGEAGRGRQHHPVVAALNERREIGSNMFVSLIGTHGIGIDCVIKNHAIYYDAGVASHTRGARGRVWRLAQAGSTPPQKLCSAVDPAA